MCPGVEARQRPTDPGEDRMALGGGPARRRRPLALSGPGCHRETSRTLWSRAQAPACVRCRRRQRRGTCPRRHESRGHAADDPRATAARGPSPGAAAVPAGTGEPLTDADVRAWFKDDSVAAGARETIGSNWGTARALRNVLRHGAGPATGRRLPWRLDRRCRTVGCRRRAQAARCSWWQPAGMVPCRARGSSLRRSVGE